MTTSKPTAARTANRTQAVTSTADSMPLGPHGPEAHPKAQAPGDTGALPMPPTSPKQDSPEGNTEAGPQYTAEGDGRGRPHTRRAELLPAMSLAEMDRCYRDLIHYDTEEELDSRRFGMGPPGTIGVCICQHNMGAGRPGDPQQPTSRAHAGESTDTDHPAPAGTMNADVHHSAAADPGPNTQAAPATSPGTADTTEEAACPQAHLGFYGVQKSQNQLQSEILLFLSNYTIKRIFSGVSPPPPTSKLEIYPAPRSTMQA